MYHSDPRHSAYGQLGTFAAPNTSSVRDSSGKLVPVPQTRECQSRRVYVDTHELPEADGDGVYTALLKPVSNCIGIALRQITAGRAFSHRTVTMTLYSIAHKISSSNDVASTERRILRQYERRAILQGDAPFFSPAHAASNYHLDLDWRSGASRPTWISALNRTTSIPPSLEPAHSNGRVETATLSASLPREATPHEVGRAFQALLAAHHQGRRQSLWADFSIAVTETGFSVVESLSALDKFNTFAAVIDAETTSSIGTGVEQTTPHDYFRPVRTPLTVYLSKARSVYIDTDSEITSFNAPAGLTPSSARQEQYDAAFDQATGLFKVVIAPTPINRTVYQFSFQEDVDIGDIKQVLSKDVIEARLEQPVGNEFGVQFFYGKAADVDPSTHTLSVPLTGGGYEEGQPFSVNADGNVLTLGAGGVAAADVDLSRPTFLLSNADRPVNVDAVARTVSRARDIMLGVHTDDDGQNQYTVTSIHANQPRVGPTMQEVAGDFELAGTHIDANAASLPVQAASTLNTFRSTEMAFLGHFMTVSAPERLPLSDVLHTHADFPDPSATPLAPGVGGAHAFYSNGLGWSTRLVDEPSNWVMPTHPARVVPELTLDGAPVPTNVSPLVARVLSVTTSGGQPFYQLVDDADGQGGNASERGVGPTPDLDPRDDSYAHFSRYTPRQSNHRLVITIGDARYAVRSARLVSVLQNTTTRAVVISNTGTTLRPGGRAVFYEQGADSTFKPLASAAYWTWVFELDRPLALPSPTQLPTLSSGGAAFMPMTFETDTGRPALGSEQESPHVFHVSRDEGTVKDAPVLELLDLNRVERPLNSSLVGRGDFFCALSRHDNDAEKSLYAREDTSWFPPRQLDRIRFRLLHGGSLIRSRVQMQLEIYSHA